MQYKRLRYLERAWPRWVILLAALARVKSLQVWREQECCGRTPHEEFDGWQEAGQ